MYLKKHDINGETYVKLDELNSLVNEIGAYAAAHHLSALGFKNKLAKCINMSENGDKWIIFCIDHDGDFIFYDGLVPIDQIPEFVRKHMKPSEAKYVATGCLDYEYVPTYDTEDAAKKEIARAKRLSHTETEWHTTQKHMFDTQAKRDVILRIYDDRPATKPDAKAEAIKDAEIAIQRTRRALNRAERALDEAKGVEREKPSEGPQKPSQRKLSCPGRYEVWHRDDGETTQHSMGFVRFEQGMPVFTNRPCKAMRFAWKSKAEYVAKICGVGFEVVDMIDRMSPEQKLLRAIFLEDGMDGDDPDDWHGDGTPAEDEEWDGEADSE